VTEPLVTVITAAYRRPIQPVIDSVREQSYPNIEHLVVVDDHVLVTCEGAKVVHLGRNWQAVAEHWGAIPRAVGGYLAHGELVCYLDDDNAYLPHHVETLVWLLLTEDADCVASAQRRDDVAGGVLTPALEYGRIDTSMVMHRVELLGTETWKAAGYASDWDLFSRWKNYRWAFTDEVTSLFRVN
jgi:hypothetical protein